MPLPILAMAETLRLYKKLMCSYFYVLINYNIITMEIKWMYI